MAVQPIFVPVAVFIWHLAGAARTFVPGRKRGSPLAQVIFISYLVLVVAEPTVPPSVPLFVAGSVGLAASVILFEWARWAIRGRRFGYIFANETPAFLCTAGPFAYVRNPFYTSYLMAMAFTALMLPSVFRLAVVVAMVFYFTAAAVQEERAFLRSDLAPDYARYKASTGRFLPKLTRPRAP